MGIKLDLHEPKLKKDDKLDMLTLIDWQLEFKRDRGEIIWECKCECGNTITINERSLLKNNHVHSCGCYQKKYLTSGDSNRVKKAGKARAVKRNKDGCNVDMLFRDGTIVTNTSGVQGVSWSKTAHKWHVYVGYKKRRANLGYYEDINDAKRIRKLGLEAVQNNTFEDFYRRIRGKEYTDNKIYEKKG